MIKQRSLGRTGLNVSELCLGTMHFGWKTDEGTSFAIMDAFHAAGGNFLQAAAVTPQFSLPSISTTLAEEVVGRWHQSRRIPRRDLVLATRLNLRLPRELGLDVRNVVRESVAASLQRLKVDYLDLLVVEWNEELLPKERLLDAFNAVVRDCSVRYVGVANFPAWRVVDCIALAFQRNAARMETVQGDYSLMTRARYEPETMALCHEHRLGFVASSPLAGGFLVGRARASGSADWSRRKWILDRFQNTYGDAARAAVAGVAARHDASPGQIALAWVLNNPTVSSAMIGVRSEVELHELVTAGEIALTSRDLRELAEATALEEVRIAHPPLLPKRRRAEALTV